MYKTIKYAVKLTLPVLFGYLVMGAAFGLLLQQAGYHFLWALLISVVVYAGSMQFVLVDFLKTGLDLLSVGMMTFSVNSRHMFYGLSFLEKFKKMGKARWYMIFSLTDETYSLLCSLKTPPHLDESKLMLSIAALNHLYWITGCVIGAIAGQYVPFSTDGVEFAMTALFVVIFVDQWKEYKTHLPALIGFGCALVSLLIFKADNFILPALIATVIILLLFKVRILAKLTQQEPEEELPCP